MNIEDFRNYCLSLKGVQEKTPFSKGQDRIRPQPACVRGVRQVVLLRQR